MLNVFARYRRFFVNYINALARVFLKKYPFDVILRGTMERVTIISSLAAYLYSEGLHAVTINEKENVVSFIFQERRLSFKGAVVNGDLGAAFGEYGSIPVLGKDVLDVGASIGDSPIYFAISGAKRVIALEPVPQTYELAKFNIAGNGFESKVKLLNVGLAPVTRKASVRFTEQPNTKTSLSQATDGIEVQLMSLKDVVNAYDLVDSVLKMDCEGCEYEVILDAEPSVLRRFTAIEIEFHNRPCRLVEKLRSCGFKVIYSHWGKIGYVRAYRS